MNGGDYILQTKEISKSFFGVRALNKVSVSLKRGEIHAFVGENGAGKSTLMKCFYGVHSLDEGLITLDGKLVNFRNPKQALDAGVYMVQQEGALSPYLSIYENIFLGHMETKYGKINWDKYIKESGKYMDMVGLKEPPETIVSKLGVGKRQLVEIARALCKKTKLLILDEPTSSLNDDESENLLNLMLELKKQGITLMLISDKLHEVLKIADTVTVLRDGRAINTYDVNEDKPTEEGIIMDMVGGDISSRYPKHVSSPGKTVMEVKHWTVYHPDYHSIKVVDNVSFYLREGEILAFCGSIGAGRTELMMSIFGRSYGFRSEGVLILNGKIRALKNPRAAINAGLSYISDDRKNYGLVQTQDIKTNIAHASLKKLSRLGSIDGQKEISQAELYRKELNIRTPSVEQLVRNLSGGNQQKVVISKCLQADGDIFIIDGPTSGIEIGAKAEIYGIMNKIIAARKSIIMISMEIPEALAMADRIYVMSEGKIKGELTNEEATQEKIMRLAQVG